MNKTVGVSEFAYRGFVRTLAERVRASLSTIETEHNFEYGTEFEIAMCEALRDALPDRYGISRGYAVEERGRTAGDDVIIFERGRFPTLALRRRDDFARKEFIPIEAVYSYIEAKHTLELTGNGPQSLHHACEQVSQVKELCGQRERLGPDQIAPYQKVGFSIRGTTSPDFPEIVNPVLGVVFARRVRHSAGSPLLDNPVEINSFLAEHKISTKEKPDLIVLGDNNLIVPTLPAPTPGQHLCALPSLSSIALLTMPAWSKGWLSE